MAYSMINSLINSYIYFTNNYPIQYYLTIKIEEGGETVQILERNLPLAVREVLASKPVTDGYMIF